MGQAHLCGPAPCQWIAGSHPGNEVQNLPRKRDNDAARQGQEAIEIKENEAETVRLIFDYYLAGASLGRVVDMLYKKQIPSPTRKAKWTRAAVDHLLSNSKYIAVVGFETFTDVQFEKSARCNIDYDKAGSPRRSTRYVSPSML